MAVWIWDRPLYERWRLGTAGYNAGTGNILSAQQVCLDRGQPARMWDEIELCLPAVTGHHAKETRTYIRRIERNWRGMGGCKPFAAPPALQEEWGCWD